jgi:hypothetical protein
MTITLICASAEESLGIERQLIETEGGPEVLNPFHEDPVRYALRTPNPSGMLKRTISRLIVMSDIVLNLSGEKWIDIVCENIGISVYHELSKVIRDGEDSQRIEEPPVLEPGLIWCAGCVVSWMSPVEMPKKNCGKYLRSECALYNSLDDAINGENAV